MDVRAEPPPLSPRIRDLDRPSGTSHYRASPVARGTPGAVDARAPARDALFVLDLLDRVLVPLAASLLGLARGDRSPALTVAPEARGGPPGPNGPVPRPPGHGHGGHARPSAGRAPPLLDPRAAGRRADDAAQAARRRPTCPPPRADTTGPP